MEKGCKWFVIYSKNNIIDYWISVNSFRTFAAAKRYCERVSARFPELEPEFDIREEYVSA